MKIKRLLLLAAVAGTAAAVLMQKKQQSEAAPENIWKPVDPLRPYGDRSEEQ